MYNYTITLLYYYTSGKNEINTIRKTDSILNTADIRFVLRKMEQFLHPGIFFFFFVGARFKVLFLFKLTELHAY